MSFHTANISPVSDEKPMADTPRRIDIGFLSGCRYFAYEAMEDIAALWTGLQRDCVGTPFQTYSWIKAVVAADCPDQGDGKTACFRPLFVVGFVEDKPVVILPLAIRYAMTGKLLTWLGDRISDYHGPLVDRAYASRLPDNLIEAIASLIHSAIPQIDAVHLTRLPASGPDIAKSSLTNASVLAAEYSSHTLALKKDWKGLYAAMRSSKSRQRLRSKYRAFKATGRVSFRRVRGAENCLTAARQILDWKSAQVEEAGRRSPFGTADAPSATRMAIEAALSDADNTSLRVYGLFRDNALTAGMLAFASDRVFYYYVSAYSPQLDSKFSAGIQLLTKTIELAARAGCDSYDLLIGDEKYKNDWADTDVALFNYTRPFTLKGRLICAALHARFSLKKKIMRTPWLDDFGRSTVKTIFGQTARKARLAAREPSRGDKAVSPIQHRPPM
ncbi:GNAT family N-acetyltransferase [Hoeflea prorocentri]|uniref:GNAT family N-acetyltransferase n=1 Tax=Hoeflea prorocentri TaxID=1922333 RepID=A0A9X3UGX0_9HYPH|nr:GNAT family N-acetyltransferase [Hoeflea prorocentri]MCY6380424.1 GNAT family N-acetyltransferase [Hoeflea prorocentri]MDA5398224.1 GNAT family N-acetyltransferase [Hoeflea prorocentri]